MRPIATVTLVRKKKGELGEKEKECTVITQTDNYHLAAPLLYK